MEDGSLKAIGQDAEKAAKGTDKATKSADKYSKKNKGVAGATSNSTKAFSKMTTGISNGLVPAYATLAANVFALTAAFGLLARNDAITKLNEGLEHTGALAGKNLSMVADKMKEITGNAISAEQAMRAVAVGTSAGFSEDQLNSLTRVAKGASLALGRDMGDAMDRLIRGAAKLEPEILDELGIMVRLDDATKKYAESINKTAAELTQFERRMAFTNAIIADGEKKFQSIQAALDPSEYGKLSATFSDLTKSIIEVINTGLGPMFGYLSDNKFALGAVVAAFGASISKDLVGSIQQHTQAAAENAKVSANQAKAQLKNIKVTGSMTKHMKSLVKAEGMSEKQLKRLQRLSHGQVNMMNKSNPMYKTAVKTRRALTMATFKFTIAQSKENASTALSMLTTHGFTLARAKHISVMQAQDAATAKAVIGQDTLTAAKIRGTAALFKLGAATKFYGTALLQAFPMIMAVVTALAILGPMVVGIFKKPEDGLSKQIKKNEERLKSFDKVVRVYTENIRTAESATEAWFKTIKPLSGLFDQVSSAMKDTNLEAQTKLIIAQAKARQQLARSKKFEEGNVPTVQTGFGFSVQSRQVTDVQEAQLAVSNAKKLTKQDLDAIRTSNMELVSGLIASMNQMQVAMESDTEKTHLQRNAMRTLTTARKEAQAVLDGLTANEYKNLKQAEATQKELQQTTDKLTAGTKAYESFNEVVTKANNLTATKTFGLFAEEIDNVIDAVNELAAIQKTEEGDTLSDKLLNSAAAEEEAEKIVKAYGLVKKDLKMLQGQVSRFDKDGNEVIGQAITTGVEKATDAVKRFKADLLKLNEDAKTLEITLGTTALLESALGEESALVYSKNKDNAEEELRIKKEILRLSVKGGQDELTARKEILEAEKQLLDLTIKRMDKLASKAKDAGMGAGAAAAIKGLGARQGATMAGDAAIEAAKNKTYTDQVDAEGKVVKTKEAQKADAVASATQGKAQAESAARLDAAKETLAGVAADMAAIGPEGALMSSAIEGALNVTDAFGTAFEVMGEKGATMADKITAGLGVVNAMVGAAAKVAKANSEAKIRAIDDEIAAEKARDGQSQASAQKIKALEAKKLAEQKKAFETNKKMKMAQTIISTATGAMAAYTSAMESLPAPMNAAVGAAMAAMVVAMGAKQLSMISKTQFQGGGSVGAAGASKISVGGGRQNTVDLAKSNNAGGELAYMRGAEGTGQAHNFKPAFAGYKNRAAGGFVVGEQGPELFMPEVPGEIIPSGQSVGGQTNVNFSISAVDATGVQELLTAQKGNIIGMIREAAHEHGEPFLETVKENTY